MINTQTSQAKHLQSEDLTAETLLEMYQKVAQLLEDHFLAIQEPLVTDLLALQGELQDAMREKLAKFPHELYPVNDKAMSQEKTPSKIEKALQHIAQRKHYIARAKAEYCEEDASSSVQFEYDFFQKLTEHAEESA